ncbi:MAG: amidohydrolase family protein [Vicinamibacterales bacterium]
MTGPPVRRGRLAVEAGRIVAMGAELADRQADQVIDGVILPGLVNAHTHLELSYLKGTVPPAETFAAWVSRVMALRRARNEDTDPVVAVAAREAARQIHATGTAVVGDISNTLRTPAILGEERLNGVVFHELLGFGPADRRAQVRAARERVDQVSLPGVRVSLAAHAPYSVSPALFAALREDLDAHPGDVSTVHVAEGAEEVEFVRTGQGPWRGLLDGLGVWNPEWEAPGTSPIAYLDDMGVFNGRVLAVHGVQVDGPDLARLRASGTTLVSCPRSNRRVGAGSPPIDAFYASHVRVAFGTDSLASAPDLNLFNELAEARRLAPRVPARWLLESATLIGAAALGSAADFGSIDVGKRAALLAVRMPDAADPEEFLVSGVDPSRVVWVRTDG